MFTRTEEQYVYALMNDFRNFCGYDIHAARRCNGKLASIGNADELALMKMLLGRNSGVVSVSGGFSQSAWIGGEYNSTSSTWGWSDGSPWFDDQEALWQDGAVSPGPNILFRTDGTEYWYQPITSDACGSAKGEGILILPADYDDPNAPFYETNDFALCQDQVINKIIDSVSTTRRKLRADAKTDRTGFDVKVDLESKAIDGDVHASESSASFGTKSEAITSLVFASAYIIMLWM